MWWHQWVVCRNVIFAFFRKIHDRNCSSLNDHIEQSLKPGIFCGVIFDLSHLCSPKQLVRHTHDRKNFLMQECPCRRLMERPSEPYTLWHTLVHVHIKWYHRRENTNAHTFQPFNEGLLSSSPFYHSIIRIISPLTFFDEPENFRGTM